MALTLKIFQPDPDKLEEIYGDSRGSFEGLAQRRKWYPAQFVQLVDKMALKMDFYSEVMSADLRPVGDLSRIHQLYTEGNVTTALNDLFRAGNLYLQTLIDLGYKGYSLSVGHVVAFVHDNHVLYFYCDNVGWENINAVQVPGMEDFDAYGLRKVAQIAVEGGTTFAEDVGDCN